MAILQTKKMTIVIHILRKYRSEFLMFGLISQIMASPLADSSPHIAGLLALVVLLLIILGAGYSDNKKVIRYLLIPLTAIWILARALEAVEGSHPVFAHVAPVTGLALSLAILWIMLDRFNDASSLTTNVITDAFIGYLIIGIAFSQIYTILDRLIDNPFNQVVPSSKGSTFLYFSMITLSSVGYGGISPVNPYLRLIAALESMIGIFYVAVVVARLVSSYRPKPKRGAH